MIVVICLFLFLAVVEVCDAWARVEAQRARLRADLANPPTCHDYVPGDLVEPGREGEW